LIREVFELRRDVTWLEKVEPQLKELGLDAAAIQGYRQAWNEDFEQKDWARWQKEAARLSNAVLDDMRMDCNDHLDQLGCLQWLRDKAANERVQFQRILDGTLDKEQQPQEQSLEKGWEL
jgi:hypothetical protein